MGLILTTLLTTVTLLTTAPNATCANAGACAMAPSTIYIAPDWPAEGRLRTRNHELGHVFDYTRMDDGARNRFRSIMHDPRPWQTPPNSPHEQFAEAVVLCAHSPNWPRTNGGGYAYKPTTTQHRAICGMMQRQWSKSAQPTLQPR